MDTNKIFKEIAQRRNKIAQEQEELKKLEDEVKAFMQANNIAELLGDEHKALYRAVTSNRFDSTAFKKDHADMYEVYKKQSTSMRFDFS